MVWAVQTCNGRGGAVAWATRGRVGWQRRREEEEKVGVGARKNRNEGVFVTSVNGGKLPQLHEEV